MVLCSARRPLGNKRRSLVRTFSDNFSEALFGRHASSNLELAANFHQTFLEYEWRFGEVNYLQPTWRYWGEEKVPGAIYTLYLKKVRYHSPSKSINSNESDDDISHLEWETVRVRFVKAGSLEKLVESLASEVGELESTYVNVFLATFRTFASPKQVLNLLLERYEHLRDPTSPMREATRDQSRKTLRQALHVWLDQFPEDFQEPPNYPCMTQLENFCARVMPDSELDQKVRRKSEQLRRSAGQDKFPASLKSSPLINQLLSTSPHATAHEFSVKSPASASNGNKGFGHYGPPHYHYTNLLPHRHSNHGAAAAPLPPYADFLDIPEQTFAQQLTKMDYELFKRVIPHQCLGAVWSRRDKSRDRDAASVVATVEQFNAVSFRVISTVLMEPDAKSSSRAKVIAKWVDIAQELRVLKNFSSLKSIISGLQSNPVYRLKKAWAHLSRDKMETFEELARIFSEENNAVAQRELLVREGTARFADTVGENDHHLQKILQKHSENSRAISYGTIPYLGTFLTDLTMIDTAIPDTVTEDNLVNFDKRRKEFEVLAQIKLLQGAAKAYHIDAQPRFVQWWESVLVLDERAAFDLSCQIEPNLTGAAGHALKENRYRRQKANSLQGPFHKKNDSIDSRASSSSGSQLTSDQHDCGVAPVSSSFSTGDLMTSSDPAGCTKANNPAEMSSTSSNSSLPSLDASLDSSSNNTTSKSEPMASSTPIKKASGSSVGAKSEGNKASSDAGASGGGACRSLSKSSLTSSTTAAAANGSGSESPYRTSEFYIIRVSIEESGPETEGVIMYKSIMIGNHERTKEVIRSAMMKHGLEGSPENYTLSQLLPDSELQIPPKANVYYAINTQHDLNFVLREKSEDLSAVGGHVSGAYPGGATHPGSGYPGAYPGAYPGGSGAYASAMAAASADSGTPKGPRRPPRDTSKARRKLLGLVL